MRLLVPMLRIVLARAEVYMYICRYTHVYVRLYVLVSHQVHIHMRCMTCNGLVASHATDAYPHINICVKNSV